MEDRPADLNNKFKALKGIVLRLEDIRGLGPYSECPAIKLDWNGDLDSPPRWEYPWHVGTKCPCDPIKHPTWLMDNFIPRIKHLGSNWHHYRFGFESVDQYLNWFYTPEARMQLNKHGFKLNLFTSEQIFVSPAQALFFPGKRLPWPYEAEPNPLVFDYHPACVGKISDMQYAAA